MVDIAYLGDVPARTAFGWRADCPVVGASAEGCVHGDVTTGSSTCRMPSRA